MVDPWAWGCTRTEKKAWVYAWVSFLRMSKVPPTHLWLKHLNHSGKRDLMADTRSTDRLGEGGVPSLRKADTAPSFSAAISGSQEEEVSD